MGFLKKIISALKTEDSKIKLKSAPFDEDGNPVGENKTERREDERHDADAEFCVFLSKHDVELDTEKAPFLLADLTNISIQGAAFSCVSKTACSPFCPDIEQELKVGTPVWIAYNMKVSAKTCSTPASCSCGEETNAPQEVELLTATVLWTKKNQFGCVFKCNKIKVIKIMEAIGKFE